MISCAECWHVFDVFEDVLDRLADAFSILIGKYLRNANIRVQEGRHEIAQAFLCPKNEEVSFSEVGLCFTWRPVEVEILFD